MGAGATTTLRAQDVLMLVGLSLLVGIAMLAWDDPVPFTEEEGILETPALGVATGGHDPHHGPDLCGHHPLPARGQEEVLITEAVAAGDTNTATFDVTERGERVVDLGVGGRRRGRRRPQAWGHQHGLGAAPWGGLVGYAVVLSRQGDEPAGRSELDAELLD